MPKNDAVIKGYSILMLCVYVVGLVNENKSNKLVATFLRKISTENNLDIAGDDLESCAYDIVGTSDILQPEHFRICFHKEVVTISIP